MKRLLGCYFISHPQKTAGLRVSLFHFFQCRMLETENVITPEHKNLLGVGATVVLNLLLRVNVMLCYVMLCYVMLSYVMLCYVMLCYVMLCYVMLCYVMLCYVMLWP
jgi:hypothetical protein